MRNTNLRPEEIAELDDIQKKEFRRGGLSLMQVRDRGWVKLKGLDKTIGVEWHSSRDLFDGEARRNVPDGHVVLTIDGKSACIQTEELLKYLRWA